MAQRERLIDVDELWDRLAQLDGDETVHELIDGVMIEMPRPGARHGEIALNLGSFLRAFVRELELGRATVESGYYSQDDPYTLLGPDVAFISKERAPRPFPEKFVPVMPDLAVEILSPSDTISKLRAKAEIYLRKGARLVWIVRPDERSVEIFRMGDDGEIERELVAGEGALTGEDVLPGFSLPLRSVFE